MNNTTQKIIDASVKISEAGFIKELSDKLQCNKAKSVIIFGAGSAGKRLFSLYKLHGISPIHFCDNSPTLQGTYIDGIKVISLQDLCQKFSESIVIISVLNHFSEIKMELVSNKFNPNNILGYTDNEALVYYTHIYQWYWYSEDLQHYSSELDEVYNLLSDEKSKSIFINRISLFTGGADYNSFKNFINSYSDAKQNDRTNLVEIANLISCDEEAHLQFNNELYELKKNEVLVDGGAFAGESTIEFIKLCKKKKISYKKIICFEPDCKALKMLKNNTSKYDNIQIEPFGLWSNSTSVKFANSDLLKPGDSKILVNDGQEMEHEVDTINTKSIDEVIVNENVTTIKLDIEGAEIEAIKGAKNIIKKCRPKLIISVYHKRNDIFQIIFLINKYVQDYKYYLRHFSTNFGETTLIALPMENK